MGTNGKEKMWEFIWFIDVEMTKWDFCQYSNRCSTSSIYDFPEIFDDAVQYNDKNHLLHALYPHLIMNESFQNYFVICHENQPVLHTFIRGKN
ncbi:hypothetical protein DERP_006787 [Dermatophagoides pteronyssinus]|uniref:Uncharacterized protein n=1 Tax=Dermatophagoides pteronyssinus TaxID=6956 RepID=A0ABQ8IS02_DERPT|nr:hypothetical protein DERP_006787 [Dermatophagoides pteronyssinus]